MFYDSLSRSRVCGSSKPNSYVHESVSDFTVTASIPTPSHVRADGIPLPAHAQYLLEEKDRKGSKGGGSEDWRAHQTVGSGSQGGSRWSDKEVSIDEG